MAFAKNWTRWQSLREFARKRGVGVLITDGRHTVQDLLNHEPPKEYRLAVLTAVENGPINWESYRLIKHQFKPTGKDFAALVVKEELNWSLSHGFSLSPPKQYSKSSNRKKTKTKRQPSQRNAGTAKKYQPHTVSPEREPISKVTRCRNEWVLVLPTEAQQKRNQTDGKPVRHGAIWSDVEHADLCSVLNGGYTIPEIAAHFQRTENAIVLATEKLKQVELIGSDSISV